MGNFERLDSPVLTLVLGISSGPPLIVYFGTRLPDDLSLDGLVGQLQRPLQHGVLDELVGLNTLPETGQGFAGMPGVRVSRDGRELNTQLKLIKVDRLKDGFLFDLHDETAQLAVRMELQMDPNCNVITTRNTVENRGDTSLGVVWLAAQVWNIPERCNEIITIGGRWGNEFQQRRQVLQHGALILENRLGRTSHSAYPAFIMGQPAVSSQRGEALSAALAWSGNHRCLVEKLSDGSVQFQSGELLAEGEIQLATGASYVTPQCILSYSHAGLNFLRRHYHRHVRAKFPGNRHTSRRRVHFNTWEACYFDHNEQDMLKLVQEASSLGAERFVLDDGWMQDRTNDRKGLGNWWPCRTRYPNGLEPVVHAVSESGMDFGLWIEPEMVNEDSDIYRQHPEWILRDGAREQPLGRNQYALCIFRDDVFEFLLDTINGLVRRYHLAYLKWDMNRDLVHCVADGRPAFHRMTDAFYRLIRAVRQANPSLEIEVCASGGARGDVGAAMMADRIWTSDNHDPHDRQIIQQCFSLFIPPEKMGCHIGSARSAITGREYPMRYRGFTALQGHLGIELDPFKLSKEDREALRQAVALYKKHRSWLAQAETLYLDGPDPARIVRMHVRHDGEAALLFSTQLQTPAEAIPAVLHLAGLCEEKQYSVTLINAGDFRFQKAPSLFQQGQPIEANGAALISAGLQLPIQQSDTCALVELTVI